MKAGTAIILASGTGERFKGNMPKQFTKLAGLPVIVHTLKVFEQSRCINDILVVTNKESIGFVWEYARQHDLKKIRKVVCGGETRQESSFIGLSCCNASNTDYVFIHDAVRPFITGRMIEEVYEAVTKHKAVDTAIPSADTIIEISKDNFIKDIPARSFLRRGQTPQAFEYNLIKNAHKKALEDNITNASDDCYLVLRQGYPVYVASGDEQNIKITYPLDLHIADKLFQLQTRHVDRIIPDRIFKEKIVAVTGGSSGIGKCVVQQAAKAGAIAIGLSRTTDIPLDVTSFSSVKAAFETIIDNYGKIDMVVNCAGDLIRRDVLFMSEDEWDYIYNVNIKGAFLVAKAALPIFKKNGYGSMVFVGSSSYTRGRSGYAAYSSSKAALVNFVQALAEEVSELNIKVNVASPGRVATPLRYRNFGKEDPATLIKPEEVAEEIINILAQDINGSVFEIR